MFKAQIRIFVIGCVILFGMAIMAPWVAMAQDELKTASEYIVNQKKIYIEKTMELSLQEKEAFWPLYTEYESGLAKIRDERFELARNFLATHGVLSNAEALDMLAQSMKIDGNELRYKQAFVAKFRQVLPGRKVVRFYQAENRFDTAAAAELYRIIPVIR